MNWYRFTKKSQIEYGNSANYQFYGHDYNYDDNDEYNPKDAIWSYANGRLSTKSVGEYISTIGNDERYGFTHENLGMSDGDFYGRYDANQQIVTIVVDSTYRNVPSQLIRALQSSFKPVRIVGYPLVY